MVIPWKFLLLALVVACVVVAVWFVFREGHAPKSASEALTWAIELQQAGRYDKAVQTFTNLDEKSQSRYFPRRVFVSANCDDLHREGLQKAEVER